MMMNQVRKWMLGCLITSIMKRVLVLVFLLPGFSFVPVSGGEPRKSNLVFFDGSVGVSYNPTAAQMISTNNIQLFSGFSTSYGCRLNNWSVGGGVGFYHSFRDGENMYPMFADIRSSFDTVILKPFIGMRGGIIYDPRWVSKVQASGALISGVTVYKMLQVGLRLSLFSRPSRFFTANAAFVLSYELGK